MAVTDNTSYATVIKTIWQEELLMIAQGKMIAHLFATTKVLGKGDGGTYKINRILRPALKTSAGTYGTLITDSDAKALTSNVVNLVPELWHDSFAFDEQVEIEAFVSDEDNKAAIANQMALSLDKRVMTILSTQCMRYRIDRDATFQVTGNFTTVTNGTTLIDTARTESDDDWNGGYFTITVPDAPGYDETQKVTDFVAATDTFTTDAWTNVPTTASSYWLSNPEGIVATDVITVDALLDMSYMHSILETQKFDGGLFRCFLHDSQLRDLWDDTDFINNANYDASERFENYNQSGFFYDIHTVTQILDNVSRLVIPVQFGVKLTRHNQCPLCPDLL